ncbi:MAG: glycine cleavage system protein GcvH [Oscillospiraceae bacterium]|nr:glycine cleavage system protein GcvH [Oscillospiraceae bacterium]
MKFPADLKYSKHHLWVRMDGDVAVVGITDYAQDSLGGIMFLDLPQVGDAAAAGESFGSVESVKTSSELIAPVSGPICAVNEALADTPDDLNLGPYRHWIVKVEQPSGLEALLDADSYRALCGKE